MKACIVYLSLLAILVAARPGLGIGQSCSGTSTFITTNFDVNPYPPTINQKMVATLAGSFSKDQYVADYAVKSYLGNVQYNLTYTKVDQNCIYGNLYTFTIPLVAGNQTGIYSVQVLLEEKQGSPVSCWAFNYHL